jgi:tetratricopeptide (TPR) repeat protein
MDRKVAAKELAALAEEAQTKQGLKPEEREPLLLALAEVALASGQEELGRDCLERAAALSMSAAPLLRLGDDLAARKEWAAAAERYAAAWSRDPRDPLPLFLRGHALAQAGQEKEGKRWQETAHLLPLGNEPVRHTFAEALTERGHGEAARRERDLLLKISAPGSFYAGEALRQTAIDAFRRGEPLKSADLHGRAMLRCLDVRISFHASGAYVGVPHFVHRQRARGLVAEGRLDEARGEIETCEALLPGDAELPVAVVPELDRQGQKKEADELFARTLGRYEKLCEEYPHSAQLHNSLAWLCAACRRNLDAGLEHARKAVELAPESAGYHDTLGEVYFQRGDREEALAAARKSVELAPKNAYFRKQLKRIEAGDPKADLPPSSEE